MTAAASPDTQRRAAWDRALLSACCLAVAPTALRGAHVHAAAGPVRDAWLGLLRDLLGDATPWRRMPATLDEERLTGGVDIAATLAAGRLVGQPGVLALADGGMLEIAMGERLAPGVAARIAAAMDAGSVRDVRGNEVPSRFCLLLVDESMADDPPPPRVLCERLVLRVDLDGISARAIGESAPWSAADIARARGEWHRIEAPGEAIESLAVAALGLGVDSPRAVLGALDVARVIASLSGRASLDPQDLRVAAALVLAPRATRLPPADSAEDPPPAQPETPAEQAPADGADASAKDATERPLEDVVLEAARAAIPAGLLALLADAQRRGASGSASGRAGALRASPRRGRPGAVRRRVPRPGQRLSLVDTLRAAAPWQKLRAAEAARAGRPAGGIHVRREDLHVRSFVDHAESTTIFIIDASGSAALHRLAETKGAVELLLADCYVRRDMVAVVAFRGRGAELLLPPTRSLVRARRCLAGLPGGGATPLAAGLDAGFAVAEQVQRGGRTATLVLLTDGRANFTRAGAMDRAAASTEALASARRWRGAGLRSVLVDTSPRPQPTAQQLASALGALYLPLPHADASAIALAADVLRQPRRSA